jgi:hypothetical protein
MKNIGIGLKVVLMLLAGLFMWYAYSFMNESDFVKSILCYGIAGCMFYLFTIVKITEDAVAKSESLAEGRHKRIAKAPKIGRGNNRGKFGGNARHRPAAV